MIGAIIDSRLEQRFGRYDEGRQQNNPIPSIEGIPGQFSSIPPLNLGVNQDSEHHEYQPFRDNVDITPAKKLQASDIGFFDPEFLDDKSGDQPIVNSGKYVIYRDVYMFVDRLKDVSYNWGEHATKIVLQECLRGGALMWFTTELTSLEKSGLRGADLQLWYTTLIERFKMRTSVALAYLTLQSYGLRDVKH